jgi:hypothetical protein
MKARFFTSLFLVMLTAGCSEAPPVNNQPVVQDTTSVPQEPAKEPEAPAPKVKLTGEFLRETEYGAPQHLVLLDVDGKSRTIDTVMACETIPRSEYKRYTIPKHAVAACGGWWAGSGDYFYAVIRKGKVVIFKGWQDEEQEDTGFHWERMKES